MPEIFIIGGPNGAGKTTTALDLLPRLRCQDYVNADFIAAGLSPLSPETIALQAGRVMLERIHDLVAQNKDFAFETTMAARSFAPKLTTYKKQGYTVNLVFLWLQNVELALARVKVRVVSGGHNIPEQDVRRRYKRCIKNFLNLYIPLADDWSLYDNSFKEPLIIAQKPFKQAITVYNQKIWNKFNEIT